MFPLTAFTSETVSHLTNLSIRQLHYWDQTGFFTPSFADSNTKRPHSRIYSFQDVVGLRAIAKLRDAGVTLQELRKVRSLFQPGVTKDWATRKFYTVGGRVFFSYEDAIVASEPLGQRVEPQILEMGPVVADVEAAVRQLQERQPAQIGRITHNRWIQGGSPVVAGTRIPTATIAWFYRKGSSVSEILLEFPRLTERDVKAALDYEHALAEKEMRAELAS